MKLLLLGTLFLSSQIATPGLAQVPPQPPLPLSPQSRAECEDFEGRYKQYTEALRQIASECESRIRQRCGIDAECLANAGLVFPGSERVSCGSETEWAGFRSCAPAFYALACAKSTGKADIATCERGLHRVVAVRTDMPVAISVQLRKNIQDGLSPLLKELGEPFKWPATLGLSIDDARDFEEDLEFWQNYIEKRSGVGTISEEDASAVVRIVELLARSAPGSPGSRWIPVAAELGSALLSEKLEEAERMSADVGGASAKSSPASALSAFDGAFAAGRQKSADRAEEVSDSEQRIAILREEHERQVAFAQAERERQDLEEEARMRAQALTGLAFTLGVANSVTSEMTRMSAPLPAAAPPQKVTAQDRSSLLELNRQVEALFTAATAAKSGARPSTECYHAPGSCGGPGQGTCSCH